jgi:hypothetical protein
MLPSASLESAGRTRSALEKFKLRHHPILGTLALKKRLVLNASYRCLLGTPRGQKTCDINIQLTSERFRSAPRTCRPAWGRLEVRRTERTGQSAALIAHRGGSPPCST